MDKLTLITCGLLGFFISWSLIPVIQRRFARHAGDGTRGFHHTHSTPIPRFGGIAIVGAFVVVAVVAAAFFSFVPLLAPQQWGLLLGSLAMFALGLRDDFKPLDARIKLAVQILIASLVYVTGVQVDVFKNPLSGAAYELGGWGIIVTVLWLVVMTNLINLIDGIDGLAGGISLMMMGLLAYVGFSNQSFSLFIAVGVAGALLGFLWYNFPPAKIYLGDGGAYFLGFLIGSLAVTNSHKGTVAAALLAPVFALALPIADVAWAILRRGLKGLPLFRPDRKHIHHRLMDGGFSRRSAVLILYGISLLFLCLAFAVFLSRGQFVPILVGVLFLILFVSARYFGFMKDWLTVGRELGLSLRMRKETRYALTLCQWLEMEAERSESMQELWTTFLFIARKFGFSQVRLVLERGTDFIWRDQSISRGDSEMFRRRRQEVRFANITAIEFAAAPDVMSAAVFEHLTELAAEAWMKASQRWQDTSGQVVRFEPAVLNITPLVDPGRVMVANAA
jgi:UDP-GlcNAc:undecaprenyl-phosphate GlcNAc-1-phosphate transferase